MLWKEYVFYIIAYVVYVVYYILYLVDMFHTTISSHLTNERSPPFTRCHEHSTIFDLTAATGHLGLTSFRDLTAARDIWGWLLLDELTAAILKGYLGLTSYPLKLKNTHRIPNEPIFMSSLVFIDRPIEDNGCDCLGRKQGISSMWSACHHIPLGMQRVNREFRACDQHVIISFLIYNVWTGNFEHVINKSSYPCWSTTCDPNLTYSHSHVSLRRSLNWLD